MSEKYKVFKGLYKIIKTPGVIKAAPKHKLKNTVGISYKNSMGTLDYRRSIFPDYKNNRSNRFARIKATPSGDPMADISQNIYKKEGKRSLERRLSAKEKIRQEWLKANNLPPNSNAKPPGFNEGVASLAVKSGSKLLPKLMVGIGAAGTMLQSRKAKKARKSYEKKGTSNTGKPSKEEMLKRVREAQKRINNEMNPDLNTPTDLDTFTGKKVDKAIRKRMNKPENQFEDAAIANNVGDGKIAGTVEAGDDPPVKKKKKKKGKGKTYAYGGRGSRKPWMA